MLLTALVALLACGSATADIEEPTGSSATSATCTEEDLGDCTADLCCDDARCWYDLGQGVEVGCDGMDCTEAAGRACEEAPPATGPCDDVAGSWELTAIACGERSYDEWFLTYYDTTLEIAGDCQASLTMSSDVCSRAEAFDVEGIAGGWSMTSGGVSACTPEQCSFDPKDMDVDAACIPDGVQSSAAIPLAPTQDPMVIPQLFEGWTIHDCEEAMTSTWAARVR